MTGLLLIWMLFLSSAPFPQTPTSVISGRIVDVDGSPAVGVRVAVQEANAIAGNVLARITQTDSDGRYQLDEVPSGNYLVVAGDLLLPTYFPGTISTAEAARVAVAAGSLLQDVDFALIDWQSGAIQVIVRRSDTAEPIPDAQVQVRITSMGLRMPPINVVTDNLGSAVLRRMQFGQYLIDIRAEGYTGSTSGRPAILTGFALTPGQKEQRVEISMSPAALISGRIVDASGSPVAAARVAAMRIIYRLGRESLQTSMVMTTLTDVQGRYTLALSPGEYYLRVETSPMVYYPGVVHTSMAQPIVIAAAKTFTADIAIPVSSAATISGTVINTLPGGQRSALGTLTRGIRSLVLVPRDAAVDETMIPNLAPSGLSETEFSFAVEGVAPGEYDLFPLFPEETQGSIGYRTTRIPITVDGGDISGIQAVIQPNVDLSGRIIVEGEMTAGNSVRVQLRPRNYLPRWTLGVLYDVATAAVSIGRLPSGEFTISNIPEGHYSVQVDGLPPDAYVADVRQDGESVYESGVIDAGRGRQSPFEIVVRAGAGTVRAVVRDPNAGSIVTLIPVESRRSNPLFYRRAPLVATVPADGSGISIFTGIAPGEYALYAWPSLPPGLPEEVPEFIAKYEGLGRRIIVGDGETVEVELQPIMDVRLIPPPREAVIAAGVDPDVPSAAAPLQP